jgi:hypothetical protein
MVEKYYLIRCAVDVSIIYYHRYQKQRLRKLLYCRDVYNQILTVLLKPRSYIKKVCLHTQFNKRSCMMVIKNTH